MMRVENLPSPFLVFRRALGVMSWTGCSLQIPGTRSSEEISFNLRGDCIVAVEQADLTCFTAFNTAFRWDCVLLMLSIARAL